MSKHNKYIGFWAPKLKGNEFDELDMSRNLHQLPHADDYADDAFIGSPLWKAVLVYLKETGEDYAQYRGFSVCRICGCGNGSREFTDGEYIFPEGYIHYIEVHGVIPPPRLLRKAVDWCNKNLNEDGTE